MNVVVASSRGAKVQKYLPKGTYVSLIEGGRLHQLLELAIDSLPPPYGLKRRYHVYFLCGIPDITRLVKDYREGHRECIYDEDPAVTAERYYAELQDCQNAIKCRGALPIFVTIPKTNLDKYNHYCLEHNKTSVLKFTDQYPAMQIQLDEAINQINHHIYNLNKRVRVSTPFLHQSLTERRGPKSARYYVTKYDLLYDGLHAVKKMRKIWAGILTRTMAKNDSLEDSNDSEDEQRKRPWLPSSSSQRPGGEEDY